MNETEIARILREKFDGLSQVVAADALGVHRTNLPTKLIGEKGPYYTILLARKLQLDVIDTLVRAGWLRADEAAKHAGAKSLAGATDVQLSQEIVKRVKEGGVFHAALSEPIAIDDSDDDGDPEAGTEEISGALDVTAEREPRPDH